MARYASRIAAVSHWNAAHSNLHLQSDSEINNFACNVNKMTNADIGGGDNPETAKTFLEDIIKRVDGLCAIIITDRDGIPVIKVNSPDTPEAVSKPNFLASVGLAVEQAGKLGSGRNRRIICMFSSYQVIHFNKSPLMISLIAGSNANTGFLLSLELELNSLVHELQSAIEA